MDSLVRLLVGQQDFLKVLSSRVFCPQVVLFVDDYLLHESLTLEEVWDMFFLDETPKVRLRLSQLYEA